MFNLNYRRRHSGIEAIFGEGLGIPTTQSCLQVRDWEVRLSINGTLL